MASLAARPSVRFDPTRDKTYRTATLGRDVVDWLAWLELGGAASRTLDSYERTLAALCKQYPDLTIDQFTDAEIMHFLKRYRAPGRRTRLAHIRSFFRWAKQTRRIGDNPNDYLPTIRRPKQKIPDVFTPAEVEALLQLPVHDAAPLAILLDAGLRKAEARHLRFKDCLPEFGNVIVRNGKGGRDRVVPMSQRLQQLLADLEIVEGLNHDDLLFYATRTNATTTRRVRHNLSGGVIGEGTFHRWWQRCLEQADVRYRNPHTARHTFATSWLKRGLSSEELAIVMGHANPSTTSNTYIHVKSDDVARHMALIEAGEV